MKIEKLNMKKKKKVMERQKSVKKRKKLIEEMVWIRKKKDGDKGIRNINRINDFGKDYIVIKRIFNKRGKYLKSNVEEIDKRNYRNRNEVSYYEERYRNLSWISG